MAVATARRRARWMRHDHGQSLIEFALVGPVAFLVLLGIVVAGIAVREVQSGNHPNPDVSYSASASAQQTAVTPVVRLAE